MRNCTIVLALFASLGLSLLASAAYAGTVTDIGTTNPSGLVEQHVANNRTARAQRDNAGTGSNERIFGQTFTAPSDALIDGVALKTSGTKDFSALSPSTLQIKVFDMNDGDGVPAGDVPDDGGFPDSDNTLLGTFDFDVSSLSYASDTWLRFDFDSTVALTAGELYGFLVFWNGDDSDNTFDVRHTLDAGSTLAGGTMRTNTSNYNDANWTGSGPWGGVQTEVSDLTFVVIPEPCSLALSAIGILGLLAFGRARNIRARCADIV